jgi:hypothetical protein
MRSGIKLVLAGFCVVSLLFACAPQVRRETRVPPSSEVQPLPPLHLEGIDKKIASLRVFLETERLNEEEAAIARSLLATYESIREVLSYPLFPDDYHRIVDLLYGNLRYLDEVHLKTMLRLRTQTAQAYFERRTAILSDYLSGKYLSVIEACADLEKEVAPAGLTSDIALLCALSLGENGRYEDALRISEAISPELEKEPGLTWLKMKSIEWQVALGKRDEALRDYEQVAARLRDEEALLKSAERNVLTERPKVTAAEPPEGEVATRNTEAPAPITTEEVLKKADELAKSGEREKAAFLLYQHRLRLEEGPEAEAVDHALERLGDTATTSPPPAEPESPAPAEPEGPTVAEVVKMASALIDGEKYEEALVKLNELKQKESLSPDGQRLETKAVEKIINRERNKAAEIFLRARNTADPEKKEELLKSSYTILKAVADKYPDSPLNKKINDNMRAIENELKKIKRTG